MVDLLTILVVLPFPECDRNGITQYVTFSDWRPSLGNIHLKFVLVFIELGSSYLFNAE